MYNIFLLSCKLVFQFSFLLLKKVNHCKGYVIFQDIEDQLHGNILDYYCHYISFWNLNWIGIYFQPVPNHLQVNFVILPIHTNYLHIMSILISYFFIFIKIFHVFLLAFACWWIAWHIPSLIPFSFINCTSVSIKKSNFTLVFLRLLDMLMLLHKKSKQN